MKKKKCYWYFGWDEYINCIWICLFRVYFEKLERGNNFKNLFGCVI